MSHPSRLNGTQIQATTDEKSVPIQFLPNYADTFSVAVISVGHRLPQCLSTLQGKDCNNAQIAHTRVPRARMQRLHHS